MIADFSDRIARLRRWSPCARRGERLGALVCWSAPIMLNGLRSLELEGAGAMARSDVLKAVVGLQGRTILHSDRTKECTLHGASAAEAICELSDRKGWRHCCRSQWH